MSTPRWKTRDLGISDLSVALDEIYFLRALLADEAGIIEAHLGYKTFPKSRREIAEEQVRRMKAAASGDMKTSRREKFNPHLALKRIGVDPLLTNHQWAAQRNLIPVDEEVQP